MLTGARWPSASATALSTSSSASLSTLKQPMPAASAWRISARVLPTPEKMILAGSPPAASTRASSPPETMSKPQPASREHAQDRPARNWPSWHSRSGRRGLRSRAGRRPARRASIASNTRRAACRARAPARRAQTFDMQHAVAARDVRVAGQVGVRSSSRSRCVAIGGRRCRPARQAFGAGLRRGRRSAAAVAAGWRGWPRPDRSAGRAGRAGRSRPGRPRARRGQRALTRI